MNVADIREYARHQRLRGVEVVEIQENDCLVRIRIDGGRGEPPVDAGAAALVDTPASQATCLARSEALGILRLSHSERLPQAIGKGDRVARGQLLALLELGEALTPVNVPVDGVVEAILASEGQRVDYGMALFQLKPAPRST